MLSLIRHNIPAAPETKNEDTAADSRPLKPNAQKAITPSIEIIIQTFPIVVFIVIHFMRTKALS